MSSVQRLKNSVMICTPIMAHSVEQVLSEMCEAKAQGADVVEVRLDCIKNFRLQQDLEIIISSKPLPVIIIYRPKWEGGEYEEDELSRLEALHLAKELGADYIEYELKVYDHMHKHNFGPHFGSKIIVSSYADGITPPEEILRDLAAHMQHTKADILKIVINAVDITEVERLFHLLTYFQIPIIAYSTGDRGLISQLLCRKFGGFVVYGSLDGHPVPGLPTLESLRQAYKIERINENTKVYGLISKPVSHSKGPILHNPAFRHVGYDGIYVPMFVDDLKQFFSVFSSPDIAGFSVGIPYKETVIEFCHEVHPLAEIARLQ